MTGTSKWVIAVLSDLMFTVKIQDAAKRAEVTVVFVKTKETALARAAEQPAAILLDLNDATAKPLEVITELKEQQATRGIEVIAFVSHVQADLIREARARGCDTVLARSAFSSNLAEIFAGFATK